MAARLGGEVTAELGALLYHQTEGNALFLVNLLEHLVEQGVVKQEGAQWTLRSSLRAVPSLPEAPQLLITKRFERLDREAQHVLEVASVAGDVFAAATVAAGLDVPVAEVEALCATLGQQHDFLEYAGLDEWLDGTVSGCYRFRHALYRQVLAERLGALQRMQVHRRMGERLEQGYSTQVGEVAAQLAVHFERGGEVQRAVHYWQQTGDNAVRRNAHPEAVAALRKGLALLATLPESPERTQHALALYLALGAALQTVQGLAAPEAEQPLPRHTRCVSRWARRQRWSRPCLGCGGFMGHGHRCTRHASLEKRCCAWRNCRRSRAGCRRPYGSRGDAAQPWRIAGGPPAPGGRQRTLYARPAPCASVPHGPRPGCCLPSQCRQGPLVARVPGSSPGT